MEKIILTDDEIALIKRKRKEEADYNKIMHEKPTIYNGKRNPKDKVRLFDINRAQCKIRTEKGEKDEK